MGKIVSIEELLGTYYKDLYNEYKSEETTYHRALFDAYVDKDIQQQLNSETINDFQTKWCRPNKWLFPINLWVSTYEKIIVYFSSIVDLRSHVTTLIQDTNFKELVKVAFYIIETIRPRSS